MQNELCKCFVQENIKEVFLLHLNRLKLKNYLYLFVMEDPVENAGFGTSRLHRRTAHVYRHLETTLSPL